MLHTPAVHIVLLAVASLTTAGLAGYAWRHRRKHSVLAFGGLMIAFTVYSVAHLLGLLTVNARWRLVWEYVQWAGTAFIPVFWLVFAMDYTGYGEMLTPRTVSALAVFPVCTTVLAWTNPWHGLMWVENTIVVVEGLALLDQPFGPWGRAFTGISYACLGIGAFLLLRLVWLSDRLYARQAALLVAGIAAPVLANVLTVAGVTPLDGPPLDLSPYAFSVTGLAFGTALFRQRLFDIVPATHRLGRDAAIRDLEEGVLIVDTDRQVIYCNPTAAGLFEREPETVVGEQADRLVADDALDFGTEDALAEWHRDDGVYQVRISPIRDRSDRLIGHTLLVQDITARKRRERRLARQRDELERLDELNGLIRGVNRALVSATDREGIERAVCDQLADSELYCGACAADVPTWSGTADRWRVAGTGEPADIVAALDEDGIDIDATPGAGEAPLLVVSGADDRPWTVVPITYGQTVYGAVGLCPEAERRAEEGAVTDREREVLAELGGLIGHAITAVEDRRLLAAESVVELDLRSEDDTAPLVAAVREADARLSLSGLVPDAGAGHLAYLSVVEGAAADVARRLQTGDDEARVIHEGADD